MNISTFADELPFDLTLLQIAQRNADGAFVVTHLMPANSVDVKLS